MALNEDSLPPFPSTSFAKCRPRPPWGQACTSQKKGRGRGEGGKDERSSCAAKLQAEIKILNLASVPSRPEAVQVDSLSLFPGLPLALALAFALAPCSGLGSGLGSGPGKLFVAFL